MIKILTYLSDIKNEFDFQDNKNNYNHFVLLFNFRN